MATFDLYRLERELLVACRLAFRQLFKKYSGEHFYGIGLWTHGSLGWLLPTAMSEEGLDEILQQCQAQGRHTDETFVLAVRWSPEDSPRHREGQEYFDNVNVIMAEIADVIVEIDIDQGWEEFNAFYGQVIDTICAVFTALDREGAFGVGKAREAVFVTLMTMDQDESILDIGRRVNPSESVQRFSAEWTKRKELLRLRYPSRLASGQPEAQ